MPEVRAAATCKADESELSFKSYEKARKVAGRNAARRLTRTNATGGITIITFTPLLGMSDVVLMFLTADQVNDMVEKPA